MVGLGGRRVARREARVGTGVEGGMGKLDLICLKPSVRASEKLKV